MLSREELKEMAKLSGSGTYFVSLYLNVNPLTNPKGDYVIRFKNMMKEAAKSIEKTALKSADKDLREMDKYLLGRKRDFKKGLAVISSSAISFWREYHLSLPVKSELIVDRSPHIKPLLDMLDNYQRYAALLVDKESARIFVIHMGEITEYGEVHTEDVPGRHKKGGWFALSQNHFERHIQYHVTLHLKDVIKKLSSFFKAESIGRLLVGGSEDAVTMTRGLLPKAVSDKIIGTFRAGMFEGNQEVMKKLEPVLSEFERKREEKTLSELIERAHKNDRAALGLEATLRAVQEGKVMRLVFERDLRHAGFECSQCGALSIKGEVNCPYCGGKMEKINYIIDLAAQKSVEQGATVEVVSEDREFRKAGRIGAFLRF